MRVLAHSGKKEFPDSCAEKFAHGMDAAVPVVEIANNTHPLGIRRPNCKVNAAFAIERAQMRAEFVVDSPVLTFGKKMQIGFAHDRAIPIRVARGPFRPGRSGEVEFVIQVASSPGHHCAKETVPMNPLSYDFAVT